MFDQSSKVIGENISLISNHKILDVEEKFATNSDTIMVNQKRLRKLGTYQPDHSFFSHVSELLEPYKPSNDLLRKAAIIHAEQEIKKQLLLPDYQVIQKIHAIDDLYHAVNVFDERLESWKICRVPTHHHD
jgi:RNA processing factor Prp31